MAIFIEKSLILFVSLVFAGICDCSASEDEDGKVAQVWDQSCNPIEYGLVIVVILTMLAIQTATLLAFGQPSISKSGRVRFWNGDIFSRENSQQITDHYTFTHVLHGILFYGALAYAAPRMSVTSRLLIATGMETGWEILENSSTVIACYRESALAQGYTGDSVLNSVSDSVAMVIGFVLAYMLPVWLTAVVVVVEEAALAYKISDNLVLNIIALVHPIKAVSQWQARARDRKKSH